MPYVKRIADADDPLSRTPDAFLNAEMICERKGYSRRDDRINKLLAILPLRPRSGNFPTHLEGSL